MPSSLERPSSGRQRVTAQTIENLIVSFDDLVVVAGCGDSFGLSDASVEKTTEVAWLSLVGRQHSPQPSEGVVQVEEQTAGMVGSTVGDCGSQDRMRAT